MILALVVTIVFIGLISLKVGSILPLEFAILPLLMMLFFDGVAVLGFKTFLGMENIHIVMSILIATIFKIGVFLVVIPK